MAQSGEPGAFSHLVVVGSSAGGIEALSRVLGSLPADFPAPVVIAQHMHPERESHLEELLSRQSSLPVTTVEDHAPLAPGTVFVVPADRHVNVTDREIEVHEDGHGRPKPSIDLLLTSAAEVFGENLVAVILSGSGTDGTDGARAVKRVGGTVVVQNPESAEFSGMPSSLAPNTVDIVSELDGIGGVLSELLSEGAIADKKDEESELAEFLEELKQSRGIDFKDYKRSTIRRRLARRFTAVGVGSLEEYRRYLEENPEEYGRLVNTFLIKVTEFFRDPEQFEHLKSQVLPGLVESARQRDEQLRLWSAGCATGEEAYSLAILVSEVLDETLGEGPTGFDVRIFATDLDDAAVDHARRGVYPGSALSALSEEQISRYFDQLDGLYYVKQPIRSMIIFGEHDLAQRSPFPRLDLVVSRNVLIYFTPELQRRTLQLFAFSLKDNGYLMLGKAESVSPLSQYFAAADREYKVFYRVGERFVMPASDFTEPMPSPPKGPAHGGRSLRAPEPRSYVQDSQGESRESEARAEERALDRLPVGVISVDDSYDIHSINLAARRLLSVHGSAVGEDLLHLVREAPYDELRPAIDSAFQGKTYSTGEFDVEEVTTGESRVLNMTCYPPEAPDGESGDTGSTQTVTILVEDVTGYSRERKELRESLDSAKGELEERRRQAEEESERRREQNARLVEGNRQLEASNRDLRRIVEELRSSNEQHQLSTEEAQASAEEVETLNEELQATNEELETVNEELQATVEELNTTNEDLQTRSTELQEVSRAREKEQRQSQKQLQAVMESVPEPMLVVEPSGQANLTNEAYRHVFGERGCVALDDSGKELPGDETPQARASRAESFAMRIVAASDDGTRRRYEVRGGPVGDDGLRGGLVVFQELPEGERG